MPDLFAFGEADVERIRRLLDAWEQGRFNTVQPLRQENYGPNWTRIGYAPGPIGARSGLTPGSGTVQLYQLDSNNKLADTTLTTIAFNIWDIGIPAGSFVGLWRDPWTGADIIIVLLSTSTQSNTTAYASFAFTGSADITWSGASSGSVTGSSTLTSGSLIVGNGGSSITTGNLTGDISTSGGTATTVGKIQGTTVTGTSGSGSVALTTGPTLTGPAISGTSSGSTVLQGASAASGTLTLPAATDTLVGRATTDTLTNKTLTSPTINGGSATALTGLAIRSTGSGAFDLTFANTENLTAGRTLTLKVNDAARTVDLAGNLTLAGAFTTSGANSLTLTTSGSTNVTLPTSGTVSTLAGTETFSNKTIDSSCVISSTASLPSGTAVAGTVGVFPQWVKVTKTYTDWSAAATSNSITVYTLPAGGIVHAWKAKTSTNFQGGTIATYQLNSLGISGNASKYGSANYDMKSAVSATNGALVTAQYSTIDSQSATTNITATASTTGANLNAATQGSVDIWILVSTAT